ncbi:hypothetical protein [Hoyosella sp. YIM 151337]
MRRKRQMMFDARSDRTPKVSFPQVSNAAGF